MLVNWPFLILWGSFGFAVTYAAIPLCKKLAEEYNVVARPGGRRIHSSPTPLLGGVAIFLPVALLICLYFVLILLDKLVVSPEYELQMVTLFLGAGCVLILGTVDDKYSIGWKKKILGQLLAVAILVVGGHGLNIANIPFVGPVKFGWFGIPLFALVIIVITNAVNLLDGLDGLAGGVSFFAAMTSGIIGFAKGDWFLATVGITVSGSLLGFLRYNFPPASIYMGDGGSLTLGFLLGTLATSCAAIAPGQRSGTMGMVVIPFLPLGLALLDVFLAVLRRWISGRHIFMADSDHLHHRLIEKFRLPRRVVLIYYVFTALLSGMTLWIVLGHRSAYNLHFLSLVGLVVIAVIVLLRLYRIENLSNTLENRPHFQFLSSYQTFMSRRVRRAVSLDELVSLLESGVRDLGFGRVEVFQNGYSIKKWDNPQQVHPDAPQSREEKSWDQWGVTVVWSIPTHKSKTYQKFLELSWYRFLNEFETRLSLLCPPELAVFDANGNGTKSALRWRSLPD
jgi:UDP-GlcNAc:undecaprenyl-phosphate/decaprenyl-phosphate GlcNAc-1-phosphate transferase